MTEPTTIAVPEFSLIVLIGPSGCGKSTFARDHFLPTEVVSSDFCRALVSDDENDDRRDEPRDGAEGERGPGIGEASDLRGNVICVFHNLQTSRSALQ